MTSATRAISTAAEWDYNGYFGADRTVTLIPGEFNADATDVFTRGHCHSLALAIRELIPEAELFGVYAEGELWHVFAWIPGFGYLDGKGLAETEEEILAGYAVAEIHWVEDEELEDLEERQEYRRRRVDDAIPFARALIRQVGLTEVVAVA